MTFPNPDTMFKPGQGDNPVGRTTGEAIEAVLRELLAQIDDDGRTTGKRLAETLLTIVLSGDYKALREVIDRTEGRTRQAIDLTGDGPVVIRVVYEGVEKPHNESSEVIDPDAT